jgi:hypothetical protein
MKPIVVCGLFAVVLLSLGVGNLLQGSQPGPLLVCRGGGALHFNYNPFSNLSPDPQIWITFDRAPKAVGENWQEARLERLEPGECAWLDRPVSESEPNRIALLGVRNFAIQWQRSQVTGISSEFSHISLLQHPEHYQSFRVTNNGQGFLIVDQIGPAR